jgi:hypothetical protein
LDPFQVVDSYTFECVVVEADNVDGQLEKPTQIKAGGIQTSLTVRKPNYRSTWGAATAYNLEDYILYSGKIYHLLSGVSRTNATTPNLDPLWEETTLNRVFLQFPSTLASTWAVQPSVVSETYGFIELRVTEPINGVFRRTWKPVRGMVEIGFSPTDIVADV